MKDIFILSIGGKLLLKAEYLSLGFTEALKNNMALHVSSLYKV